MLFSADREYDFNHQNLAVTFIDFVVAQVLEDFG